MSKTELFTVFIFISLRITLLESLSLFLKIVMLTKLFSGPLTRFATSESDNPFTFLPSIDRIMSFGKRFANCAGVPSITFSIRIFPATDAIFTPIPVIFELIELFCSRYSCFDMYLEYGSFKLASIVSMATLASSSVFICP